MAGEKRYRVEILVLSHLHHEAIPSEAGSIRDFSTALDFLSAEDDDEAEDDEATRDEDSSAELLMVDEPDIDENEPEVPWANVIAVLDMSDVMLETWRRLRLSAPFRPEQYLAWEQSADEPFPSLRIHDQEVVLIDDPYADLRETDADETEEDAAEDNGVELQEVEEILQEYEEESELPDPTLFYRLDGTVMLRRSRFLHLDIDIELRQAVFDEPPLTATPILSDEGEPGNLELPLPSSFLIHQLKQSRQVKSRRMEYFDSPVLGVLLWITPFELEEKVEGVPD